MSKKLFLSVAAALLAVFQVRAQTPLGHWLEDGNGLPAFSYDAALPYQVMLSDGTEPKMRNDPWFLLGNYRITVFTHVDGTLELITGERSWARLNQGERVNSGVNAATITLDGKTYSLVGPGSLAEDPVVCSRVFGCGYALWTYRIGKVEVERMLSVLPSRTMDGGDSALQVSVRVTNRGRPVRIGYGESVAAEYRQALHQRYNSCPVRFVKHPVSGKKAVWVDFEAVSSNPLNLPGRDQLSVIDVYAPSLFLAGEHVSVSDGGVLASESTFTLGRGKTRALQMTLGCQFDANEAGIADVAARLSAGSVAQWKEVLPSFPEEPDRELARELVWDAYVLEAMATYSAYYGETKIPQGTVYDYYWGQHASARDHFQHGLPAVYYHPELARSILRYMAKRTTEWGEVRLIETGYGNADASVYITSDQQLFFFLLLSEYLRVTGDYSFLDTQIHFYPKANSGTMLEVAAACFDYLRNFVSTGSHGLVRLLNSDWLDNVYGLYEVRYNDVIYGSESHMNSAMVLAIFPDMVRSLRQYAGAQTSLASDFADGMKIYYDGMLQAFMKDLGDRTFSRRMYYGKRVVGDEDMCLEPQAYALMAEVFPVERKKTLYAEMQRRLFEGEALGAAQCEKPVEGYDFLPAGARDNGGFWYSLNGPAICGVATFDTQEAMALLKRMTFANYAKCFPDYWTSWWSASDNVVPAIGGAIEGLPDQSWDYYEIPVYCAHPHAWTLYCYYRIKEREEQNMHPYAIAMWDFSWLERRMPGAGFEDWNAVLDGFVERGYDAVRIDAYPQLVASDPEAEWTLEPVWNTQDWGWPDTVTMRIQPALNEFIAACRDHGVKVGLSSWFRRDTTHREMTIRTPEDLADCWIATLSSIEAAGLLDNVIFVDLCNEWPGDTWAPFFHEQHPEVYWGNWEAPSSLSWMEKSINRVRERYPNLPLLFSIDSQDLDKVVQNDIHFMDILEHHLWMAHQNDNEFNNLVGYHYEKFSPEGYENLVANAEREYRARPDYWNSLLVNQILKMAEVSRQVSMPIVTTECWALIDYKDLEGLHWDWIKDLCELGVRTAASTGRWTGVATSNFCAPQFRGMWDDVTWHKRMTSLIKQSVVDKDIHR